MLYLCSLRSVQGCVPIFKVQFLNVIFSGYRLFPMLVLLFFAQNPSPQSPQKLAIIFHVCSSLCQLIKCPKSSMGPPWDHAGSFSQKCFYIHYCRKTSKIFWWNHWVELCDQWFKSPHRKFSWIYLFLLFFECFPGDSYSLL